ncbi:T9SS type A sorting domain-containing protein [Flavobacterium sp. GCM10027622]|uniref:T9SS type A sorting domain-containing protein n=1 Tax=unclassified Flavobacterium TaxID=196869 RepID=UPI00361A3B48
MKKNYFIVFMTLLGLSLNAQTTLTQWNFDSSSTTPSTGTGTLTIIGGTTPSSTAYPTGNPGLSYSITTFPGDTSASGTAGYRFATSTVGYNGITVSFDVSGTNQSSKWQRYEYTVDGTNWITLGNNNGDLLTTFISKSFNLPATCDNNPNVAFRIVSIFAQPTNTAYASVTGGGYNGNNGRWQVDNFRFSFNTLRRDEHTIPNLKMYPNPAKSQVTISSDNFAEKKIEIYNTLGKMVLAQKTTNNPIDITSLSKGIYMVKISEEGKTDTLRLLID